MGLVTESREREEKPWFTRLDIEQRASWELIVRKMKVKIYKQDMGQDISTELGSQER